MAIWCLIPPAVWLGLFAFLPLGIIIVISLTERGSPLTWQFTLSSYARLADPLLLTIVARSLWMACVTTALCLVVGYPLAYFIVQRRRANPHVALFLDPPPAVGQFAGTDLCLDGFAARRWHGRSGGSPAWLVGDSREPQLAVYTWGRHRGLGLLVPAIHGLSDLRRTGEVRLAPVRGSPGPGGDTCGQRSSKFSCP